MKDEYLTIEECATLLKVSQRSVGRWIKLGILPALKLGKTIRVLSSELERLGKGLQQETEKSTTEGGDFMELSSHSFNRLWDNPADAEAWDHWSPTDAKP